MGHNLAGTDNASLLDTSEVKPFLINVNSVKRIQEAAICVDKGMTVRKPLSLVSVS
jgi:hypothetical protein